jgi:hypothetical protein
MKDLIGKFIAEGKTRRVYEYVPDSSYVVKINKNKDFDNNLFEYNTYLYFKKINLDYWLSPCKYENNLFLMKKTESVPPGEYNIPCYFSAVNRNWGMTEKKLVRIDYSWNFIQENNKIYVEVENYHLNMTNQITNKKTQKFKDEKIKILINETKLISWTKLTHIMKINE